MTACSGLYRKTDSTVGKNPGTIIWVPGHSGIQQIETVQTG